jgi:BlaI family penicillinase repressor
MKGLKISRPTDAELAILRVLWQRGPSTVRHVHQVLSQIMTEKELLERDESERTHIYQARLTQEQTQEQLVGDLLEKAFGGSASQLVMRALAARPASADELERIRLLLDEMEGGRR